jgi:hypothetical protein
MNTNNVDPVETSNNLESTITKAIYLDNGAHLVLSVDKNFGELPVRQREFISGLITQMTEFSEEEMAIEEAEMERRQREAEERRERAAA